MKEHIYFIKGMHCASCEILIEKRLLEIKEIKSVEASVNKEIVRIIYEGEKPSVIELNKIFKKENYFFFERPIKDKTNRQENNFFIIAGITLLILAAFFIIKNSGLGSLINVNSTFSLPMFFLLGLLAGVSSCAALVGGLILSMSKQWFELYSEKKSTLEKLKPHLMFNAGRIISYTFLGGVIGALGSKLQISLGFTSFLIIVISVMMIFLGLQMLGVKTFCKFQLTMPKFITRGITDETKFQGKYMPALLGALTFFLPCGFTVTAQGLALISGSWLQGSLIMFLFVLGTLPGLLAIGFSAVKFSSRPHLAGKFLRVAGILVLFFALYNINAQLNVLGMPSFSNIKINFNQINSKSNNNKEGLPLIVNGKQIIKMTASSSGYQPDYFKVKAGIPVRWEIKDIGTSGCTNAIISKSLFSEEIVLTPDKISIKEFTPEKSGKYKFSCWMGMVSGVMEVVDSKAQAKVTSIEANSEVISSGAQSCGAAGRCSCYGQKNF